jgi:hypothetical protein
MRISPERKTGTDGLVLREGGSFCKALTSLVHVRFEVFTAVTTKNAAS